MTHQTELVVIFYIMIVIFLIPQRLVEELRPKRVVFLTDVDGIYDKPPENEGQCLYGSRGTLILSGWTLDRIEIITFAVSLHFIIPTMFYLSSPRFNVA